MRRAGLLAAALVIFGGVARAGVITFDVSGTMEITIPDSNLNSDVHSSAEYRAHLVGVMARRAVAGCG